MSSGVLPYQIAGSWQYTDSFYRLLQERQAAAAALVDDSLAVGQLPLGDYTNEEQWSAGVELWEAQGRTAAIWPEDSPTYVETRQYEQEIARLSALLDPEQTWFRFQVRTDDGSFTLGGNLAPGNPLMMRWTPSITPPSTWGNIGWRTAPFPGPAQMRPLRKATPIPLSSPLG